MRSLLLATLAISLAALPLSGCLQSEGPPEARVLASFYPLGFFASRVAGTHQTIDVLVPAGVEPHDWEPTPGDRVRMERALVLVLNGAGFEPWADEIAASPPSGLAIVDASGGIEYREGVPEEHEGEAAAEPDPHVWLDPVHAKAMARNIESALREADSGNASFYSSNLEGLTRQLDGLHGRFETGLRECANRNIVTTHAAFGYLAARYNFTAHSISGLSPESEPAPARIAEIVELVRQRNITHVFFETLVNPRVAETIAREAGVGTLVLNPIEGLTEEERAAGETYVTLMDRNLGNLRLAMGCA